MVDRVIQKKKWGLKRLLLIFGIVALIALIGFAYYATAGKSKLTVDTERLTISEVKKGSFQEYIPVNGVVMPLTTIYLDAIEGGRVEAKYVEDGAMVKKGQPLMKLVNTDLELSLATQETGVFNLLTQMQISRNAAQQNTVGKLNQQTDVDNALKEAERLYKLDKHLYEEKAIGSQEYRSAENAYNYQVQKKKLADQILKQDSVSVKQQFDQDKQSYERAQNGLQIMRRKVGDLTVRSQTDGQLTSLDAEVGQSKRAGDRLGQIDVQGGYKVRVDIDEHYISRIFTGLTGEASFAEKNYKLKIIKVFTQVTTGGKFQVDMQFIGETPQGIRRGQTLQIRLNLSEERQALLLPKGGFFQKTGGSWIFKLSDNGKTAYKADIQLGNQNTDYYEVLQGLKAGDRVVTSSYETYGDMQELILQKE